MRERNWIAAHIRERRYELDLTQKEVAERAGTSHSFISKVEGGNHLPTIPVLKRILVVLDEELLIGIEPGNSAAIEAYVEQHNSVLRRYPAWPSWAARSFTRRAAFA